MLNIISTGSNYIFMIMCAIYALSCFTVFLPSTEEQQIKRMNRQERFMFIFHFICYGVLFLKTFDVRILILYVAQAVFFKFLIFLYEHLYMDCSRILMNHTCFLLIIGFVMLTRLDFAEALKQFAIVAVCSFVVLAVPFIMEKAYWLKRLRWIYGLIGLLLLASVFVIGTTKNGSTNWISLGPVALQPSEFCEDRLYLFPGSYAGKAGEFSACVCDSALFCLSCARAHSGAGSGRRSFIFCGLYLSVLRLHRKEHLCPRRRGGRYSGGKACLHTVCACPHPI